MYMYLTGSHWMYKKYLEMVINIEFSIGIDPKRPLSSPYIDTHRFTLDRGSFVNTKVFVKVKWQVRNYILCTFIL